MKKFRFPKFSIFIKLLLIVVLFGVLIDLAVFFGLRLSLRREPNFIHRVERTLLNELGNPPDSLKITRISKDLGWNTRFESTGYSWCTNETVPKLAELRSQDDFEKQYSFDDHFRYIYQTKVYTIFKVPHGTFIIETIVPRDVLDEERAAIILIVLLGIIFSVFYYIIRRLFKPVKELTAAVQSVGNGNYYVDVPVRRKDELGELASSISSMAKKIGNAIKAKEQLLLDVSHELRTPLTRIKLGLEVGSEKDKINDDVNEMEKMIAGLLESYRTENSISEIRFGKVDITELIEDTADEYISKPRLNIAGTGKPLYIAGDEEKIQMVIRNLITNALKYSGGEVSISVYEEVMSARIIVKDSGIGISENDLQYIFEPFYRADHSRTRATGGYGLGLSICKKIVDAHKGSISVKSELGKGTEVTLVLNKFSE